MAPFYGWGSTASRIEPLQGGSSWYSLYRPRKDERLSQPWSHPVVLNTRTLDWESSALTTTRILSSHSKSFLVGIYLFRVNIRNTSRIKEICSKVAIKTTERRQKRPSFFIVKCEQISNIVLMFPLKPLSK